LEVQDHLDKVSNWSSLSWQEKREERFKAWLSPQKAKFNSPEAEKAYKQRATRFIKAIKLEEPDRVPVMLPIGNLPIYYSGSNLHSAMYDLQILKKAWIKFMDDFGDMDYFRGPTLISAGQISENLDLKTSVWPGHGLPVEASMVEYVEGEYMKPEEYDLWLNDPSDYNIRCFLPRTAGLLASFRKLPALRNAQAASWVAALADPDVRNTFQKLMDLSAFHKQWLGVNAEIRDLGLSRGYTSFNSGFPMIGAPFDYFADHLRGTRGISMDMYRDPQKLHEVMERWLTMNIASSVKNFPMTECPIVMMPLHKGDDTFMSDKQFQTFYWPYLRRLLMAMVDEGMVPMPFAEGKYTNRLKLIADTPRSAVVWYFDQTDMAEAKKVLGDICCLVGNVPTSVVMTNTPAQVKEYCRKLIETCAPHGGYILAGGASIDKGNIENLRAMMDAANQYGKHK
jgi:hypothetical protein